MRCTEPPGRRSTRQGNRPGDGGEWVNCRNMRGETTVICDVSRLRQGAASELDAKVLAHEIRNKLNRATEGKLRFDSASSPGEVKLMAITGFVLEIVLTNRITTMDDDSPDGQSRMVRIYYAEPDRLPGVLLMLSIRAKVPGTIGLEEQNMHAIEAKAAAEIYDMYERTHPTTRR